MIDLSHFACGAADEKNHYDYEIEDYYNDNCEPQEIGVEIVLDDDWDDDDSRNSENENENERPSYQNSTNQEENRNDIYNQQMKDSTFPHGLYDDQIIGEWNGVSDPYASEISSYYSRNDHETEQNSIQMSNNNTMRNTPAYEQTSNFMYDLGTKANFHLEIQSPAKVKNTETLEAIRKTMIKRDKDITMKRKRAIAKARLKNESHKTMVLPKINRKISNSRRQDPPNGVSSSQSSCSTFSTNVAESELSPKRKMSSSRQQDPPNGASSSPSSASTLNDNDAEREHSPKKISTRAFLERDREISRKRKVALAKARGIKMIHQQRNADLYAKWKKCDDDVSFSSCSSSKSVSRLEQLYQKGKKKRRSDLERSKRFGNDDMSVSSLASTKSASLRLEQLYQKGKKDRRNDLEKATQKLLNQTNDDVSVGSTLSTKSTPVRLEQLYQKGKKARRFDLKKSIREKETQVTESNYSHDDGSMASARLEQLYQKGKEERRSNLSRSIQRREVAHKDELRDNVPDAVGDSRFDEMYRILGRDQYASIRVETPRRGSGCSHFELNDDDMSTSSSGSTLSCASRRLNQHHKKGGKKKTSEQRKKKGMTKDKKKSTKVKGGTDNLTRNKMTMNTLSEKKHKIEGKCKEEIKTEIAKLEKWLQRTNERNAFDNENDYS